jgi:heme/copper-type cytochrome/quinol oxidase subunit 3
MDLFGGGVVVRERTNERTNERKGKQGTAWRRKGVVLVVVRSYLFFSSFFASFQASERKAVPAKPHSHCPVSLLACLL